TQILYFALLLTPARPPLLPYTTLFRSLDIGTGQRRSPEEHRPVRCDPPGIHLVQALLHRDRGLDQQTRHSDGVGAVLDRGVEDRSEEHTSELQSRENLVCRLLHEKKKI